MTLKLTAFAAATALTLITSSAFAFAPERQRSDDAMDNCDIGAREAGCDVQSKRSNVMHLVPFSGERNQFYRETEDTPPRHHRFHPKSQS